MGAETEINLGADALATLAVETWRAWKALAQAADLPGAVGARYALRKIRGLLEEHGITYLDSAGTLYDPGMALDVVDIDEEAAGGVLVIKETLAPAILLNGQVIAWGQVVLARCDR